MLSILDSLTIIISLIIIVTPVYIIIWFFITRFNKTCILIYDIGIILTNVNDVFLGDKTSCNTTNDKLTNICSKIAGNKRKYKRINELAKVIDTRNFVESINVLLNVIADIYKEENKIELYPAIIQKTTIH